MGSHAPAFTVASFAIIIHCLLCIFVIPATTPPAGHPPNSLYIPNPAKEPISKKSASLSFK